VVSGEVRIWNEAAIDTFVPEKLFLRRFLQRVDSHGWFATHGRVLI